MDAIPYLILSNIYVKSSNWEDAASVKKTMRDQGGGDFKKSCISV
jgi:hypothetical protein